MEARSDVRKGLRRASNSAGTLGVVLACLLAGIAAAGEAPPGERTVAFPSGAALGTLQTRDWGSADDNWEKLGPASGEVRVPAGKELRLDVAKEAAGNLSALSQVGPEALQAIRFNKLHLGPGQLKPLAALTGLREVAFSEVRITGEDLQALSGLPRLETLRVEKSTFGDADTRSLKRFRPLKRLVLARTGVTDKGLAPLKALNRLESLDLSDTRITDKGLRVLSGLKHLKSLDLQGAQIAGSGLKHLARLASLEHLVLPPTVPVGALGPLKGLPAYDKLAARRSIQLQVVDAESNAAIPNVSVEARIDSVQEPVKLTTDDQGKCEIFLPAGEVKYLGLRASKDRYVPMRISWNAREGAVIPETCTLPLPQGTTLGGVIVDEQGAPIKGVVVELLVPSREGSGPQVDIYRYSITTDETGKWRCDIVPAKLDDIWIKLQHPDYAGDSMYGATPKPPMQKLRDLTGQMVMKRGMTVAGRVTDQEGKPIAGASVAQGEDRWGSDYPETRTDDNGAYQFKNAKAGAMSLTVQMDGYAPDMRTTTVEKSLDDVNFKLDKGKLLRGRVVDKEGKPLAGVTVVADTWRGCRAISWRSETNNDGRFEWDSAPADEVAFEILKQGYMDVRKKPLKAGDEEAVVTLVPPLLISGKVVDADTGQPVPEFTVLRGISWAEGRPPNWERRESVQGRAGAYTIAFDYPHPGHLARVEAPGYLPAASRVFKSDEEAQTWDVQLRKGQSIAGVVHGPDGKALAGADVALCTAGASVWIRNGRMEDRRAAAAVETDAAGQFSFPPQGDPYLLVVVHDAGFAKVSKEAFEKSPEVNLQPWARVEVLLRIGAKPGAHQTVILSYESPYDPAAPNVGVQYQGETDDAGAFVFDRALPGEGRVCRGIQTAPQMTAHSHGVFVEVKAGETVSVTVGGTGRNVKGRLVVPEDKTQTIDWRYADCRIMPKQAQIEPPKSLSSDEAKRAWYAKWQKSAEGQAYRRARTNYASRVQSDGSFEAEDIPAGSYTLEAAVHEPPAGRQCGWGKALGKAGKEFEVAEGSGGGSQDGVDLGEVQVVLTQHLAAGEPVPDFEVKTVDGKPLTLASFRGKYVLLDFWATWCGPCRGETPFLKQVYDAFGTHPKFALVSLSLDRDPETPRKYAQENGMKWAQGFLGDWSAAPLPTQYGVEGIPALFLIDPEGKLAALGLRGDAILDAVKKVLH